MAPQPAPQPQPTLVNRAIRLADFSPHPRNYNQHGAEQIDKLAASLRVFGQVRSAVVWRKWFLAGTGLALAAKHLGWSELRADVLPDDYPEERALAYLAADNELARQSDPDLAQLAAILEESAAADGALPLAMGYSDAEYDRLLSELEVTALADSGVKNGWSEFRTNDPEKVVKVVVACRDVGRVEAALRATGEKERGRALLAVCEVYLAQAGEGQFNAEPEDQPAA